MKNAKVWNKLSFFKHVFKKVQLERDLLVHELHTATGEEILSIYERMSRKSYAEYGTYTEREGLTND